ncbi:uncharacterized protein LOC120332678 [Styela clava]
MTGVTVLFLTFVTLINVVHCQLELSGFRNTTLWAHEESQNYVQNRTTLPRAHINMTSLFKDARSTIIGNFSRLDGNLIVNLLSIEEIERRLEKSSVSRLDGNPIVNLPPIEEIERRLEKSSGSPRVRSKFCQRCPCACKTLPRKNGSFSRPALRRYVAGSASENSPKRTRFNRSRYQTPPAI